VDFLKHPAGAGKPDSSHLVLPEHYTPDVATLAAREAVHLLDRRTRATGGLILLDRGGNPGFAFNTPRMAYGYVAADGSFVTSV
jgi:isoaspartyl peptidase/L-asparaginase-like protein (Ntn-hydrolase superfamily)